MNAPRNLGAAVGRALGLSLLIALAALAATAAAAYAGEFRINGKTFQQLGIKEETSEATMPAATLNVPGLKMQIACTAGQGLRYELSLGLLHTILHDIGCTVAGNPNCKVFGKFNEGTEEFEDEGKITANAPEGELVLNGGKHYGVAKGAEFASIYLVGAKCTLPEENLVSGSAALRLPGALEELVEQPVVHVSKEEEKALGVALKFGAEPAFLEGKEEGFEYLTGAHKGEPFGFE